MVEFKKNIKKLLPYDREVYQDFLGREFYSYVKWYGVSVQLPGTFEGRDVGLAEYLNAYEEWFKNIVLQLDNGASWIVNHDDNDRPWFPNEDDTLMSLRDLFRQNNIPNKFKGALAFSTDDLLKFSRDIITYTTRVFKEEGALYSDLDISHSELPFILKIFHHDNIDLLSTNKALLKEVIDKNQSDLFIVREYRGTTL